jgi:hypothetical protein
MNRGNVNRRPQRRRVIPTNEKNAENSYFGVKYSKSENQNNDLIVIGTTKKYPVINPKANNNIKDVEKIKSDFFSRSNKAGWKYL